MPKQVSFRFLFMGLDKLSQEAQNLRTLRKLVLAAHEIVD